MFCVFIFQVFEEQTMSSVQTTSLGVVCFDTSRPEGSRREGIGGIHVAEWCSIVLVSARYELDNKHQS